MWLRRVLSIILIYVYLIPPRAQLQHVDQPYVVHTTSPKLCVHTRLTDEVEDWKVQYTLQLVREMGATHIVEFFPWAYAQPTPSTYDWRNFDRLFEQSHEQGLKVIARMGLVPAWAQTGIANPTLNTLPVSAYPNFAQFVAEFAERYQTQLAGVIIWNEPNISFEWGYNAVDAVAYVDLLRITYETVKRQSPHIPILLAGLAPTLEPLNSSYGLNDLIYLEQIYEAGGNSYFDGVAVHTYGFTHPPDAPADRMQLNFRRVELLHGIMERFGDGEKPVIITETGWNDDPAWVFSVKPSQRIQYTLQALHMAERWEWLDQMCLWVFRTPAPLNSYQDGFALVSPSFVGDGLYSSLQQHTQGQQTGDTPWLDPPTHGDK